MNELYEKAANDPKLMEALKLRKNRKTTPASRPSSAKCCPTTAPRKPCTSSSRVTSASSRPWATPSRPATAAAPRRSRRWPSTTAATRVGRRQPDARDDPLAAQPHQEVQSRRHRLVVESRGNSRPERHALRQRHAVLATQRRSAGRRQPG